MRLPVFVVQTGSSALSLRHGARRISGRAAFTLLEILLAVAIGVVLMGALYAALNVQLRHARAGRDVVEQSTLVRALLARMSNDIATSVGSVTVAPTSQSRSQTAQGPAAGTSSSPTTPSSTTAQPASSSSANNASSSTSSTSSAVNTNPAAYFNIGVQGDAGHLILYVSQVPREINWLPNVDLANVGQPVVSDLRRICYWLAGSGDQPLGLARQEVKLVMSDDLMGLLPPDVPDEASYVIAEEVRSVTFSYFDGSSWQDAWDGSTPGADGVTPIGPPLAIAIVLGTATPRSGSEADNDVGLRYYRHVVAIPTANGISQATTNATLGQ